MSRPLPMFCVLLVLGSACSAPPGLTAGKRIPPSDQPVALLPLDDVLAQAQGGVTDEAMAADLAARAARLRARAAANQ